jgi:hypothetical protein
MIFVSFCYFEYVILYCLHESGIKTWSESENRLGFLRKISIGRGILTGCLDAAIRTVIKTGKKWYRQLYGVGRHCIALKNFDGFGGSVVNVPIPLL